MGSSSDSAIPPARLAANCECRLRPATGRSSNPFGADDRVVAGRLVDEQECHAIDDERLADARDEPFAEAVEIEVAVQVARKSDERPSIVVLVTIEGPVERRSEWRS